MSVTDDLICRLLIRNVTDYAIYMLDGSGTVLSWNEGAVRTKGYASEEIVGRNFDLFYTTEDRAAGVPAANLERAARDGTQRTEGWRLRKDGSHFWAMITIDAVHDEHGTFVGFVKVTRDLTEKYDLIRRIEHQATHDALTGILNRGGVLRQLTDALDKAQPLAVHYIDLDSFKAVNDNFGHPAGDQVLVTTARRLRKIVGGHGFVGRIGGDEFVVVQPNLQSKEEATALAAAIGKGLRRPMTIQSRKISVGASVGFASAPIDGTTVTALLRAADQNLYTAKCALRPRKTA